MGYGYFWLVIGITPTEFLLTYYTESATLLLAVDEFYPLVDVGAGITVGTGLSGDRDCCCLAGITFLVSSFLLVWGNIGSLNKAGFSHSSSMSAFFLVVLEDAPWF